MRPLDSLLPRDALWGSLKPSYRPQAANDSSRDWPRRVLRASEEAKATDKTTRRSLFTRRHDDADLSNVHPSARIPTIMAPEPDCEDEDMSGIDLTNLCPPIQSPSFSIGSERSTSPRPSQLVWDAQEETWVRTEELPTQGFGVTVEPQFHSVRSSTPSHPHHILYDDHDLPDEPPPCYVQSQLEEASRRANMRELLPQPRSRDTSPGSRWETVWARRVGQRV